MRRKPQPVHQLFTMHVSDARSHEPNLARTGLLRSLGLSDLVYGYILLGADQTHHELNVQPGLSEVSRGTVAGCECGRESGSMDV